MARQLHSLLARPYHAARRAYEVAIEIPASRLTAGMRSADIAFFFKFFKPPYGGGNQFLLALWRELEQQGYKLENNQISHATQACIFNSHNFDAYRLNRLKRAGCQLLHRVDGPITVYRGVDDGSDRYVTELNHTFADITVFQSEYSRQKHLELGLELKKSHVITNASDPAIFYPRPKSTLDPNRKIKLISSSWSRNPRKGAAVYQWLDQNLDWSKYEYTFVGNLPEDVEGQLKNIRQIPAVPSAQVAIQLRQHDIYITASQAEACSNAVVEALSCGLPVVYLNSGSHPEVVGRAGLPFQVAEEIPNLLNQIANEYVSYQTYTADRPTLSQVAQQYLSVMGVGKELETMTEAKTENGTPS